jgi:transcription elongation factor GreA
MPLEITHKLAEEIKALERELHHELPKEIQKARELGDLSENAEYAAAKERQDLVGARIAQLKKRLADLSMVDLTKIRRDAVGLGSKVLVYDVNQEREVEYHLVTTEDSDVPNGKISTTSPIGRALMGKKAGEMTTIRTPGGEREMEIVKLTTIHELESQEGKE